MKSVWIENDGRSTTPSPGGSVPRAEQPDGAREVAVGELDLLADDPAVLAAQRQCAATGHLSR